MILKFDRDYPGDGDLDVPAEVWAEWLKAAEVEHPSWRQKPYHLGIVACSKSKLNLDTEGAVRARYLYTGQLFKASLAAAEVLCERVVILSALHGVVDPERLLGTYEKKLPSAKELRRAWGDEVDRALEDLGAGYGRVLCLAPADYWSCLENANWAKPLKGLGIGQQKAKLKLLARAA